MLSHPKPASCTRSIYSVYSTASPGAAAGRSSAGATQRTGAKCARQQFLPADGFAAARRDCWSAGRLMQVPTLGSYPSLKGLCLRGVREPCGGGEGPRSHGRWADRRQRHHRPVCAATQAEGAQPAPTPGRSRALAAPARRQSSPAGPQPAAPAEPAPRGPIPAAPPLQPAHAAAQPQPAPPALAAAWWPAQPAAPWPQPAPPAQPAAAPVALPAPPPRPVKQQQQQRAQQQPKLQQQQPQPQPPQVASLAKECGPWPGHDAWRSLHALGPPFRGPG